MDSQWPGGQRPGGQLWKQCKWRHLVMVKFWNDPSGAFCSFRDYSSHWLNFWVRCASGNVWRKERVGWQCIGGRSKILTFLWGDFCTRAALTGSSAPIYPLLPQKLFLHCSKFLRLKKHIAEQLENILHLDETQFFRVGVGGLQLILSRGSNYKHWHRINLGFEPANEF